MRSTQRITQTALLAAALSVLGLVPCRAADEAGRPKNFGDMKVWFKHSAKGRAEALAIGNGRIGAVLFGGTESARIELTEETMWTNGPRSRDRVGAHKHLPKLWELLDQGEFAAATDLMEKEFLTAYTARKIEQMGILHLAFEGHEQVSDYRRELDFDTAVCSVRYGIGDASFQRESFVSAVDQVFAMVISCDKPGRLTFDGRFSRGGGKARGRAPTFRTFVLPGTEDTLVLSGKSDPPGAGVKCGTYLKIMPHGGKIVPGEDTIRVEGADRVVLMLTAATNFNRETGTVDGPDPSETCREHLAKAVKRDVDEMKRDHIADHRGYFRRATLDLGNSTTEQKAMSTDERLARFRKGDNHDPDFLELVFQFGRYLLISASRPGTQAATLTGIWPGGYGRTGGNGAFHLDINIAQNYWPAESTALGDCHLPLVDLLNRLLPNARKSARNIYDCNGAVCALNVDGWLTTGLYGHTHYCGQWVSGFGWHAQHAWNHYDYSGDEEYLKNSAWPVLKASAEFYMDYNRPDPKTGKIYIGPSGSPETGFELNGQRGTVDYGVSIDQEVAHEVLSNCLKAAKVLEIEDNFVRKTRGFLPKLALPKISTDGRLMEWRTERKGGEHHRHRSLFYGFCPGQRLSLDTHPTECAALRKSFDLRVSEKKGGVGFDRIDWAKAWDLNTWARLREPEKFDKSLRNFLTTATAPNLHDVLLGKCPYVIDGNCAVTAGMTEAVLQSRERTIHLLPCLPQDWQTGSFSGFRARGGVTIDASWTAESLTVTFTANRHGTFEIRHEDEVRKLDLKAGVPMKLTYARTARKAEWQRAHRSSQEKGTK